MIRLFMSDMLIAVYLFRQLSFYKYTIEITSRGKLASNMAGLSRVKSALSGEYIYALYLHTINLSYYILLFTSFVRARYAINYYFN